MVAWIFSIGQFLDSFGTASRLPFVLLSHLTVWIWCNNLATQINDTLKLILLLVLTLHPLTGLGGFVANPDIPFLFFWTLSLLAFNKAIEKPESKSLCIYLGASLGLAFCSKYLIALILPPIFIYLFLNKKIYKIPFINYMLTALVGFVFSLPVLIWNYQNDWASLTFQINHGLGQNQWRPSWTLEFMLGTAILLFPPFLFHYIKSKAWKSTNIHNITFITLLTFFIYTTLKGDTELNWPIIIYPSFFLLITPLFLKISKSTISYLIVFGLITITLIGGAAGLWGQNLHGRLVEAKKYERVYDLSKEYRPLFLSTYQAASYFWYLSKTPFYKLAGSSRVDFYDSLTNSFPNSHFFYFMKEQYQVIPIHYLQNYTFTKILDLDFNFEIYEARVNK